MCKAHVIRFSCSHGLLMSLEFCSKTPCPLLKTTSKSLPQQPNRCYKCEKKRNEAVSSPPPPAKTSASKDGHNNSNINSVISSSCSSSSYTSPSSSRASCTSSIFSDDGNNLLNPPATTSSLPVRPLPKQPAHSAAPRAGDYVMRCNLPRYGSTSATTPRKPFAFTCSASHLPPPHYDSLPAFLPHQNHDCPTCQFEAMCDHSETDITADATRSWSLVRDDRQKAGRPEWEWKESRGALTRYVDERRQEEKEMLFMVARKWEQDLRAVRVCCDQEAGLSLMS